MKDSDDVHGLLVLEPSDPAWQEGWRYAYQIDEGPIWVKYATDVAKVRYVGEWLLPMDFQVLLELSDLPYTVRLRFVMVEQEPRCVELTLAPERRHRTFVPTSDGGAAQLFFRAETEFTSDGLRKLPIARLQRLALLAAIHSADGEPYGLDDWADLYASGWKEAVRPAGVRLTDDHYKKVADTYRRSLHIGNPTEAVREEFHVSRSTAGRWVMETRRRGHLGKTTAGRMGEQIDRGRRVTPAK